MPGPGSVPRGRGEEGVATGHASIERAAFFAPSPIFTADPAGRVRDSNLAARVLLGAALERRGERESLDAAMSAAGAAPIEIRTGAFGRVVARASRVADLDPATGAARGATVYWEIVSLDRDEAFRRALAREHERHATWEVYAASYDRVLPRLPFYREAVARHLCLLERPAPARILDLGAGTGNVAVPLLDAGHRVTAVDLSRAMLDRLRAKLHPAARAARAEVHERSAESLQPFPDERFDAVTTLLAYYDMDRPLRALREALRVLRPGGTLVVTEPRRAFDLEDLMARAAAHLAEIDPGGSLAGDWRRVTTANRARDPGRREARLFAEDIAEILADHGFAVEPPRDSHHGHCATLRAVKAHAPAAGRARRERAAGGETPAGALPEVSVGRPGRGDAAGISRLYRRAYSRGTEADAADHYPFPQFMDPAWFELAVADEGACWVVARAAGEVVGVLGAMRNVGAPRDRVAELCGLVVGEGWRGTGVATAVFEGLFEDVSRGARFMLAETRTANAGGWRTARKFGFRPIGFEPFAHLTPAGSEPMLMLGWVAPGTAATFPAASTAAVRRLAGAVLGTGPGDDAGGAKPAAPAGAGEGPPRGWTVVARPAGAGAAPRPADARPNAALGLARLEGRDPGDRRYARIALEARNGAGIAAECVLTLDRNDRRARIGRLRGGDAAGLAAMAAAAAGEAQRAAGPGGLTVVLDVRADAPRLHAALEAAGFFPTVYYPGLVADGTGRADAVQFTRLGRHRFEDALGFVRDLDWPQATEVVASVRENARGAGGGR